MKTPNRGNQDEQFERDANTFQGRGYHGNQGNMDVYSEGEGYYGSISRFYGDLPEEEVDTEQIDTEFKERYQKLLNLAKKALTEKQYQIFSLYFLESKSQEEVSRKLKVSQQTVDETTKRILEILRMFESEVTE